jgi:RNA polymerase sigma-B factor
LERKGVQKRVKRSSSGAIASALEPKDAPLMTVTSLVARRSTPATHPDHLRAEQLLKEAESCTSASERRRLQDEAVLLAMDIADGIVRRYRGRGIDEEDLVQVARLGVVKAARRYRSDFGSGFAAFAVPTISGEIKRHFRDCGWAVRPPRRLQELRADLGAAEEDLWQALHRAPSVPELAERLGIEEGEVFEVRACRAAYHANSLDAPTPSGDLLCDLVADESDTFGLSDDRDFLRRALAGLTERERRIVHLRFVEEHTQAEIGQLLGVSQMQVSRLLASILKTLRASLTAAAA